MHIIHITDGMIKRKGTWNFILIPEMGRTAQNFENDCLLGWCAM
jgi:hypothetical protein